MIFISFWLMDIFDCFISNLQILKGVFYLKAGEAPAYDERYVSELNFIERYGLRYLKKECPGEKTNTRKWDDEQREKILRIERRTLWIAGLSGAVSGGIIAGMELVLRAWLVDDVETADWNEMIPYYAVNLAFVGFVTVIEVIFLFWLVLSDVARMACIGRLGLAERPDDVLTTGISRAAMDMPNPQTSFYGINPYHQISGWKLMLYTAAYRAKVGATSIIMRMLLRRVFARAALRSIVPLLAIPLYAFWNVVICYWIMREARGRAAAPIAIAELVEQLEAEKKALGKEEQRVLVALIAEGMMGARDSHPSYLLLLSQVIKLFDMEKETAEQDFDWDKVLDRLAALDHEQQKLAIEVLKLSVILDGPPNRRQRRLLKDACDVCGLAYEPATPKRAYTEFIQGQGMNLARFG